MIAMITDNHCHDIYSGRFPLLEWEPSHRGRGRDGNIDRHQYFDWYRSRLLWLDVLDMIRSKKWRLDKALVPRPNVPKMLALPPQKCARIPQNVTHMMITTIWVFMTMGDEKHHYWHSHFISFAHHVTFVQIFMKMKILHNHDNYIFRGQWL